MQCLIQVVMVVNASYRDSLTSTFQNSHIRSSKATIGFSVNKRSIMRRRVLRHMIDVGFIGRVRGGIGIHDVLKGGVIKGEGLTGISVVQIRVCRGIWGVRITCGSVSGGILGMRVRVMGIDSPCGWRGGSGGGIVLFELLDGHITQEFVDVGRKKDGARRPSGVGSSRRRGRGRFPRG